MALGRVLQPCIPPPTPNSIPRLPTLLGSWCDYMLLLACHAQKPSAWNGTQVSGWFLPCLGLMCSVATLAASLGSG